MNGIHQSAKGKAVVVALVQLNNRTIDLPRKVSRYPPNMVVDKNRLKGATESGFRTPSSLTEVIDRQVSYGLLNNAPTWKRCAVAAPRVTEVQVNRTVTLRPWNGNVVSYMPLTTMVGQELGGRRCRDRSSIRSLGPRCAK